MATAMFRPSPCPGVVRLRSSLTKRQAIQSTSAPATPGPSSTTDRRAPPSSVLTEMAIGVPGGPYLADQLLLPFALAGGGSFTTVKPSQHSLTAAAVIERFLERSCVFTQQPSGTHLVEVR